MYKTVRKGDTSLQYTILPQTDQAAFNGTLTPEKVPASKVISVVVIFLICIGFIIYPFILQPELVGFPPRFSKTSVTVPTMNVTNVSTDRHKTPTPTIMSKTDSSHRQELQRILSTTIALDDNERKTTIVITESSSTLKSVSQLTTLALPKESSTSTSSSSTFRTSFSTTLVPSTVHPKKSKMPRVTLKLRENETVPQMYMKAGIASYKKGNITTSVLAHGLSLEGLIFKTPEGTIKPWVPCLPGSHSYFNWANASQITKIVHFVLAFLGAMTIISLIALYCVQRKGLKRKRQNIEEPDTDNLEGDNSILLSNENEDTEGKE